MRLLVYISGPITKGDQFVNVKKAMDAFNDLMDVGIAAYCPHWTVYAHQLRPREHDEWMAYDIEAVLPRCNAVLRLPGDSIGADMEVKHARGMGIPVLYSVETVIEWYREAMRIR